MHEIHHLPSIFREKRLDTRSNYPSLSLSLDRIRSCPSLSSSTWIRGEWILHAACPSQARAYISSPGRETVAGSLLSTFQTDSTPNGGIRGWIWNLFRFIGDGVCSQTSGSREIYVRDPSKIPPDVSHRLVFKVDPWRRRLISRDKVLLSNRTFGRDQFFFFPSNFLFSR